MSLNQYISIDTHYTRSISLERDGYSLEMTSSYIPTTRSLLTLNRFAETVSETNTPRSWALIGPYGSGKSSFAVFLTQLLNKCSESVSDDLLEKIKSRDQNLYKSFSGFLADKNGMLSILITGSPEPLIPKFLKSLKLAIETYWINNDQLKSDLLSRVDTAITKTNISLNEILELVEHVRAKVESSNGIGVLIIFDELGKFLEYEARHYGTNDIYLLQLLAEHSFSGRKANIYLFSLMHQGFEQYARGLGQELRNEWNKIQGRFESIPFLETTEQTIRILGSAFKNTLKKVEKKIIKEKCEHISEILESENALQNRFNAKTATELFSACYPLHPVTVLILPSLCQKMAQNERTLFSYLGSREQYGFPNSLSRLDKVGQWILPWEVYDYFILNQPAVLTDPTTHRRWAEVVTALERLGDVPESQERLLKTIGLLNIIGAHSGFKASKQIISLVSENSKEVNKSVEALKKASVVQYRKFSNEYRVWQGSDFDLDQAVEEEHAQLGQFSLAEVLNDQKRLQPVVARRHTIETGSLRYYVPFFIGCESFKLTTSISSQQRLLLCLAETSDDIAIAKTALKKYSAENDVVAIYPHGGLLREAVGEVLALRRVEINRPELNSDPIALREFRDRLNSAERIERNLLASIMEKPFDAEWFWKGKNIKINSKRALQKELSAILDSVFKYTPKIHNELINRDKPSAQAAAARNKLISALVNNLHLQDLGITKFPAEKGIYRAFLFATGIHKKQDDTTWVLSPPSKNDQYNFYPTWKRIDDFLSETQNKPKSFAELSVTLSKQPYGVKAGVLPLFYLTIFLCKQDELALFEQNVYVPYITEEHIERFMKRPENFSVQLIKLSGIRASLFKEYMKVLYGEKTPQEPSLHTVARPLARFISCLETYTKTTSRLSDAAISVRKSFDIAKSPTDLLFNKLPAACGFFKIEKNETDRKKIQGITIALVDIIRELRDAYSNMVEDFIEILSRSLIPDSSQKLSLDSIRKKVASRYEELTDYAADVKGTKAFIEILSNDTLSNDNWVKRLLSFLGGRASEKWSDSDRDRAIKKLNDLSRRLIDLRVIQTHYLKSKSDFDDGFDIIRLRSMRHGRSELERMVEIDDNTKTYIDKHKDEFRKSLNKLDDSRSRLALLAEMVEEELSRIEESEKNESIIKISNE